MHRHPSWPLLLVSILVIALAVLAHLQVTWINQVTEAHGRRSRMELDDGAHRITEDMTGELLGVARAFELRDVSAAEVGRRYERWNAAARHPRLVRAVYVMGPDDTLETFDGHALVPVEWPASFAAVRFMPRELFDPDIPAIVLPVHGARGHAILIVELDAHELYQVVTPEVVRRQFHEFDFAVARGDQIVYRSDPSWPAGGHPSDADLARPLLPRREEKLEPSVMLFVRHHGQPFAVVLEHARRLHLAVAFGVLSLLAASFVILALSLRRAERLRRQQLEFVAGVTHELHTPLAALASAGQNLADGISVDTAKYGETIMKEARRLGDLVDDVLQFASIESQSTTRADMLDIRDVIGDAVAQCHWLADEQHVQVETAAPESLPAVRGDRAAVTRAVQNLVANAIRHGRDGGWVSVRASADNGDVLITVQDRGPGIAAADLPHLFEPFYRGRDAQARGSGLGLTIVQGVARAHDGSVHAANRREGGAEFTLRFPSQ